VFVLLRAQTLSLSLSLCLFTAQHLILCGRKPNRNKEGEKRKGRETKTPNYFLAFVFFFLLLDFCLFFCSVLPIIFQDKYFFPKESFLLSLQQSNIKQNPTLVFVRCFDSLSIIIFNLSSIPYL